jgi:subtilase family serine protease
MKRRLSLSSVLLLSALLITAASAQDALPLLTRHVRAATVSAPLLGQMPTAQRLRLVLTLPLRNQAELDNFLKDVYDPSSPTYHQFLSVEEFTARFGPTQNDYDAVAHFAEENGFTVVGTSANRLNLDVMGSVANIEKAFHVSMGLYQHPTEPRAFYAPDREPSPDLGVQLWHITGLDNYSIPKPALVHPQFVVSSNATTGSGPSSSFCGSDMRAAYYGGTALTGSGQSLGLLEYYGTDLADLNTYYTNVHQTNNVPITLDSTDGTNTSCTAKAGCDDTEQTLDMTQALGMAPGLSSLVMYVGSSDAAIFNAMATAKPLNAQLSSSWTWYPADPATDAPYFQEFAAQGQNLFQASGDSGRWSGASEIYPADDVYVTAVGGTDLTTDGAGGPWNSETAWADGGGGIAPSHFAIPSWQTSAASGCSACSKTYRNGPDVSANANFTFYVCSDQTACTANYWGGTSFATPMWAGYLALANQQSLENGGTVLGFINPTLYATGLSSSYDSAFHDITSGSNGYSATTGYDLATGWGSPNGSGLIDALLGTTPPPPPPNPNFTVTASPGTVTIARGHTGTTKITTTISGGFDAAISLSGIVITSYNPNPIAAPGAGTSTMTIKATKNAVLGNHTLTITATGGGITQTTTVVVDITN